MQWKELYPLAKHCLDETIQIHEYDVTNNDNQQKQPRLIQLIGMCNAMMKEKKKKNERICLIPERICAHCKKEIQFLVQTDCCGTFFCNICFALHENTKGRCSKCGNFVLRSERKYAQTLKHMIVSDLKLLGL